MDVSYKFSADGMNAVAIPTTQFSSLKATSIPYSPLTTNNVILMK